MLALFQKYDKQISDGALAILMMLIFSLKSPAQLDLPTDFYLVHIPTDKTDVIYNDQKVSAIDVYVPTTKDEKEDATPSYLLQLTLLSQANLETFELATCTRDSLG